ncbi:MAG: response regulator [Myxococcales bacterium]|nr:response regulator [Myxococcales bacterium]
MERFFDDYAEAVGRNTLRMLMVEDNEPDAVLMLEHLRDLPVGLEHRLASTREEVRSALDSEEWDVVVSDFYMPGFDALEVLEELERRSSIVPLVVVSGRVGEENAVAALKRGASDFVAKDQLMLLPASIARSLRESSLTRQREAAEVARRLTDAKFRRIVETASEGVLVVDGAGRPTYANARLAEMLGLHVEELLSRTVDELLRVVGDSRRPSQLLFNGSCGRRECQLVRPDGAEAWAIVSCSGLPSGNDGIGGYLMMLTETTEQKALQTQLLMADRMAAVGLLAAGVAHEINNPLAVTLANLDLISRDADLMHQESPTDVTLALCEEANDAREAAQRVAAIVKDLRLFSRAESDEVGPTEVHPVVESCARMAAHQVRHRASLFMDLQPVPPVQANEARLSQVILNLLVNAAQSIPEATGQGDHRICISTSLDGDRVAIAVQDTGVGISEEAQARLFTPFYTTKPVGVGTGLGLAISGRIVQAWQGEIRVQSRVGQGSTFTVYLPVSDAPVRETAPSAMPVSARRARILVVDDEAAIRTTIYRALCDRHDVSLASGPRQALEELANGDYDQILCDIMMPEMTGPEMFKRVSQSRPDLASRFVFLSGGVLNARLHEFVETTGRDRVLEKPFSIAGLLRFVERHLEGC